jgi:hypothetical protein
MEAVHALSLAASLRNRTERPVPTGFDIDLTYFPYSVNAAMAHAVDSGAAKRRYHRKIRRSP